MLLTIDVGNTNITMGVFREEILLGMFRMTTKRPRTSDEYGMTVCGILEHRAIDPKEIRDFDRLGYRFSPERSDDGTCVFLRRG